MRNIMTHMNWRHYHKSSFMLSMLLLQCPRLLEQATTCALLIFWKKHGSAKQQLFPCPCNNSELTTAVAKASHKLDSYPYFYTVSDETLDLKTKSRKRTNLIRRLQRTKPNAELIFTLSNTHEKDFKRFLRLNKFKVQRNHISDNDSVNILDILRNYKWTAYMYACVWLCDNKCCFVMDINQLFSVLVLGFRSR